MLNFGQREILAKLMKYCAYQERCHREVKEKLREFACYGESADQITDELIRQGFLNEERFARAFAGGKFRQKRWGRIKITNELKLREISPYNIRMAMSEINDTEYREAIEELIAKKKRFLPAAGNDFLLKKKIYGYLLQKGYEPEIFKSVLYASD